MKYFVIITCLLFATVTHAQTDPAKSASSTPAHSEEQPAPGFDIQSYLRENLNYPADAKRNNVQGRVIVKFIINEDGKVSNATIVRGIGGECDEEAKRVVMHMPAWKPGKQDGKPVKVYYTLPILFKLDK